MSALIIKIRSILNNKYLNNKYTIILLVFIIWVAFIDNNSLIERIRLSQRTSELLKQKEHYLNIIQTNSNKLREIKETPQSLEKFAREQYFMKKENEDIFIIIKK